MFNFNQDIAKIPGWLTEKEGTFLYNTAQKIIPPDTIVEIGSWKGRSTICLAKGSQDGQKAIIYAIDPHLTDLQKNFNHSLDTFKEFETNIKNAGISKSIKSIRKTSAETAKNFFKPIGFLFIDGAHYFRSVQLDYHLWQLKVKNKGIIAFHDTCNKLGPFLVTTLILLTSSQVKNPKLTDTITSFEKTSQNSLMNRVENFLFLFYRLFFIFINSYKLKRTGTVLK